MTTVRKLSELTFEEASALWNAGFEGYVYNMNRSVDAFIHRFGEDELLPSLSVVAFVDDEPAGFILTGLRTINGKKISWNGGTGVITKHRRSGIGKAMMDAVMKLYEENDVNLATLEAVKSNENAIKLYRQYGYEIKDRLLFLQLKEDIPTSNPQSESLTFQKGPAQDALALKFFNDTIPWQTHWKSLRKDGELLLVLDKGQPKGYFLYKRIYNQGNELTNTILYTAGFSTEGTDQKEIASFALKEIFADIGQPYTKTLFNFPASNKTIIDLVKEWGFTPFGEQVFMIKNIK